MNYFFAHLLDPNDIQSISTKLGVGNLHAVDSGSLAVWNIPADADVFKRKVGKLLVSYSYFSSFFSKGSIYFPSNILYNNFFLQGLKKSSFEYGQANDHGSSLTFIIQLINKNQASLVVEILKESFSGLDNIYYQTLDKTISRKDLVGHTLGLVLDTDSRWFQVKALIYSIINTIKMKDIQYFSLLAVSDTGTYIYQGPYVKYAK